MNRRNISHWIPAFAWMGFIFYLSSRSGYPGGAEWMSIAAHIVEYTVLCAFLWFALRGSTDMGVAAVAVTAVALSTLFGVSDEWHQSFVPGRMPDPFDVLVDFAAAAGASLAAAYLARE